MFQNYIVSAFRNSIKNPIFSLINIGGLAIGIAICILVYLFTVREFNFDSWAGESSHIYRTEYHYILEGWGEGYSTSMPIPLRGEIAAKVPEVSKSSFYQQNYLTVKKDNIVFYERISEVNAEFLEMFKLDFVYGQQQGALDNLNSVILSKSTAQKYFGDVNPIGETVVVNGNKEMTVTAVIADIPTESHLKLDILRVYDPSGIPWVNDWNSNAPLLYVEVQDPSNIPAIDAQFASMVREHTPFMEKDTPNPNEQLQIFLQPFKDIHLKSEGRTSANANGNLTTLYGYIAIAILILAISCVNYINLSTARASKRIKEVCLRKVMGAERKDLLYQFMGETLLFAVVGLLLALVMVELTLPFFVKIIGGTLALNLFSDLGLWVLLLGLVVFLGVVAGVYPALYISRFSPSKFLHSNKSEAGASMSLRNILVVFQFFVASALIASATVIYSQMSFISNFNVGFPEKNLVILRSVNDPLTKTAIKAVEDEIRRIPGVENVSRAYNVPTDGRFSSRTAVLANTSPDEAPSLRIMPSGIDFLETLKVPLLAGRYFTRDVAHDSIIASPEITKDEDRLELNAILSKGAMKKLGLASPEAAIGKTFEMSLDVTIRQKATYTIVGVVDDLIYDSAANRGVEELVFYNYEPALDQMLIRISEGQAVSVMPKIEAVWKDFYPDVPIRSEYMEDRFSRSTESQQREGRLFLAASLTAIFISSLGLLGLAIFMAERRTKEIGIRKVMGAKVVDIVRLFSWQFSKPIIIANVFGLPLAWYFATQWLQGFNQRIDLEVSYFIIAAVITLLIGWLTVASHALKAASKNPITALRVE